MNVEDNLSNESDPDIIIRRVLDVSERKWKKKMWLFCKPMMAFVGKTYYFKHWYIDENYEWWIGPGGFMFHQDWLCDPNELAS